MAVCHTGANLAFVPLIGMLEAGPPNSWDFTGFDRDSRRGLLREPILGHRYRWADGNENRLQEVATELVQRKIAVIVTLEAVQRLTLRWPQPVQFRLSLGTAAIQSKLGRVKGIKPETSLG